MATEPRTLLEANVYFADPDNCVAYLVARRWPAGVMCPTCLRMDVAYIPARRVWQCKTRHPKSQFSVKVGTIFEDSPISLDKWLLAMWMLANCKNGVSSYEIHRDTGVSQKSAWFMLQRIRLAMQGDDGGKLSGEVEVDETFIGGKARNMHLSKRQRRITGTGGKDKAMVMGLLERGGKVRTKVVASRKREVLQAEVRDHVTVGSALYSDELPAYTGLAGEYMHKIVNHAVQYVDGQVHTNGLENYWSLLKRGISGTYVSVEPFHLFRYLDEQAFRYNNRKNMNDSDRFDLAVRQIVGKRLTWYCDYAIHKGCETVIFGGMLHFFPHIFIGHALTAISARRFCLSTIKLGVQSGYVASCDVNSVVAQPEMEKRRSPLV